MSRRLDQFPGDPRNKLFIGGVNRDTDEKTFADFFAPYGKIVDCILMRHPETKKQRGFGFVTYEDNEAVEAALNIQDKTLDGKALDIKRAVPLDQQVDPKAAPKRPRSLKIFVGGLPHEASKDDLKEYFEKYGALKDYVVMTDRGFGFVTFENAESIEAVLQETDHEIKGKAVACKEAVPKDDEELSRRGSDRDRGYDRRYDDRYDRRYDDRRYDRRSYDDRRYDDRRYDRRGYEDDRYDDRDYDRYRERDYDRYSRSYDTRYENYPKVDYDRPPSAVKLESGAVPGYSSYSSGYPSSAYPAPGPAYGAPAAVRPGYDDYARAPTGSAPYSAYRPY